jgi:hypothetical protein
MARTKRDQKHIALIGDLVRSREIIDREAVQRRLGGFLDSINRRFADHVSARLVVTVGDEFQGLLRPGFPLREFLWSFEQELGQEHPARFGAGFGTISTDMRTEAVGMDGPCFHRAREALSEAKGSGAYLMFKGFGIDEALNGLFALLRDIETGWTDRQRRVIEVLRREGQQTAVAQTMGVTKQNVNSILKAAKYEIYSGGWKGLERLLELGFE